MKSIWLIIKSNLKRRKIQNLTLGISLMLASMLFSTSIGILTTMQEPFDRLFNTLSASHINLLYDSRTENENEIIDWFNKQPEVFRVAAPSPYYLSTGPFLVRDKKIDGMMQLTELNRDHLDQDKLTILTRNKNEQPGYGEIWLPNYLASRQNINIGDTILIPVTKGSSPLIVSALVADPLYGSGMVNPTRAWIRAGSLSFLLPMSQLNSNGLGIRMKSESQVSEIMNRFNKTFHFGGTVLDYSLFKAAFLSTYQILAILLFIFSLLTLGISIFLISMNISKNIHDDFKLTGVLRTLGFTPAQTTRVYIIQYLLLAICFFSIGFIGSYFILQLIIGSVMKTLGSIDPKPGLTFVFGISAFFLLALVWSSVVLSSLKVKKIRPFIAIRYGSIGETSLLVKSKYNFLKYPRAVALGLMMQFSLKSKSKSLLSFCLLFLTVFVLVFSVNISSSLSRLKYNKAAWGFEGGDIQLGLNQSSLLGFKPEQFKELLRQEKDIHSFFSFGYYNLTVLAQNGRPAMNLLGKAYEDDISSYGLLNLEGNHPTASDEIALCAGTSSVLDKHPGDSIAVFIEGQKMIFHISGVYQDISNMGQGFRLRSGSIKKLNPIYEPTIYSIQLKSPLEKNKFKNYLLGKYGEAIHVDKNIEDRIDEMGIIANLKATMFILSVFIVVILLLSVWNDVLTAIRDDQKTFGILKTIGYTPGQLRISLTGKMILIACLSLAFGIPIALAASPLLMSQVTRNLGLVHFPFLIDSWNTVLVIPILLTTVFICAWTGSAKLKNINPRILIIE